MATWSKKAIYILHIPIFFMFFKFNQFKTYFLTYIISQLMNMFLRHFSFTDSRSTQKSDESICLRSETKTHLSIERLSNIWVSQSLLELTCGAFTFVWFQLHSLEVDLLLALGFVSSLAKFECQFRQKSCPQRDWDKADVGWPWAICYPLFQPLIDLWLY